MKLFEYSLIGERVYTTKLPNGLSVFVVPKQGFHKKYAFFATDYGGADRRFKLGGKWIDTPEGVAHFLEHKMFDTKDGNALTTLSANGASPNAFTSTDITAYHFECVEKFEENLKTLLEFVSVPYFTKESVSKEQGIIGQEIRMIEDDPEYVLYYGMLKSLFKHNPMRDSVAGTVESIAEISADTLYNCHKIFYNPSNMALCVAGDVDPDSVSDMAQRLLPTEPGEIPERDYGPPEALTPEQTSFMAHMDVSQPIFFAGCKIQAAGKGREMLKQLLVGSLASELLAGHSSPLYFRLYSEGLVSSDFAATFESVAGAAYSAFGGECLEYKRVFDEVLAEVRKLSEQGPDNELFERVKKAALGRHIRSLNSFDTTCYNFVNGYFRDYDSLEAPEMLASITTDDVSEFFTKNLIPENMTLAVVKPREAE